MSGGHKGPGKSKRFLNTRQTKMSSKIKPSMSLRCSWKQSPKLHCTTSVSLRSELTACPLSTGHALIPYSANGPCLEPAVWAPAAWTADSCRLQTAAFLPHMRGFLLLQKHMCLIAENKAAHCFPSTAPLQVALTVG